MSPETLMDKTTSWLGVENYNTNHDQMILAAKATITYVNNLPHIDTLPNGEWSDNTILGAIMLCAKLSLRNMSPNGIEEVSMNGVAYTAKYDPDIARLLYLDSFSIPIAR